MQLLKLNLKGFVALRNSPGVVADLDARAQRIAEAAGDGFIAQPAKTNMRYPMGRARAAVITGTAEAMIAEAVDGALTKAIDAGRG